MLIVPALCSVLSFGFAGLLVGRFARRGRPYFAVWSLALVFYGISTGAEVLGGATGWTETAYRWWYLTGAIGVAAYLGMGSAFLHRARPFGWLLVGALLVGAVLVQSIAGLVAAAALATVLIARPTSWPHTLLGLLLVGTVLAAMRILTAPIDHALLPAPSDQATGQAFDPSVRALTPLFNIPGALALLAGALMSARARSHVASNVLIAVGALVPSLASSLARFGFTYAFYAAQLVGLLCILGGFVIRDRIRAPATPDPSA
jgi:hypothetical protein